VPWRASGHFRAVPRCKRELPASAAGSARFAASTDNSFVRVGSSRPLPRCCPRRGWAAPGTRLPAGRPVCRHRGLWLGGNAHAGHRRGLARRRHPRCGSRAGVSARRRRRG
jgi:hypothetical protein